MTKDPFATLDVPATMDLDDAVLEARYVELSRATHPDHAGPDLAAQADAMARSAELNDAYRELRDPWRRARVLCERLAPGITASTKTLDGAFLMEAMELSEAVAGAPVDDLPRLLAEIDERLDHYLGAIREALANGDAPRASRLLHESRYWQKARADLRERRSA